MRLRHIARINPPTPEFDALPDDTAVPFLPLEAVWPADRLDTAQRRQKRQVASGYTRIREGDILVPKITPTFQADRTSIAQPIEGGVAAGTTELHIVRSNPGVDRRYVRYLLSSRPFLAFGEASMIGVAGQKRVPDDCLRDLAVPVLDRVAQGRIADFLDVETSRIDALIERRQRMEELLRERRRALVADQVSSPADSAEVPLRFLLRERDVRGVAGEQVLSVYREFGVVPKASREDNFNKTPDDLSLYKLVLPGDLVVNKMKAWQGSVGVSAHRGVVSGDYLVCQIVASEVSGDFLHYLLRSPRLTGEFGKRSKGIRPSQWRLYWEELADIRVCLPGTDVQRVVAARLCRESARVDRLLDEGQRMVALLSERRQAVITAAVTGQLPAAA